MKRILVLAFCLLIIGSAAFALEMAAGGGILVNPTWQGGMLGGSGYGSYGWTFNRTSIGGFGFFGFSQYAEANLAFLYKAGEVKVNGVGSASVDSTTALTFGLYGKYPFPISDKIVLFPTLGLDFEINLADSWKDAWNDLWIRAGAGVDYFLSEILFLRGHLVYGVTIPVGGSNEADILNPNPGHGLLLKAGIGYMF
jgi:hypothetical protein